ncbi:hypothetical protein HK098_004673 [Nowakowskiella sp. JEL0407]|nr:hypothetical protein HK098_004673 [Nowakowskiella sp. JEL0407]
MSKHIGMALNPLKVPVLFGTAWIMFWDCPILCRECIVPEKIVPVAPVLLAAPVASVVPIAAAPGFFVFSDKFFHFVLWPAIPAAFIAWWRYFHSQYLATNTIQYSPPLLITLPGKDDVINSSCLPVAAFYTQRTNEAYAVIGSTFLGDYVTKALLERGETRIYVLDTAKGANAWLWEDSAYVTFIQVDVLSAQSINAALLGKSITTVFNCIDFSSGPIVHITNNIIQACLISDAVIYLIHLSNVSVFLGSDNLRKYSFENLDESITYPTEPLSHSIHLLGTAERHVLHADKKPILFDKIHRELRTVVIRPVSNILGYNGGSLTGNMQSEIISDINKLEDFIYVEDVVQGLLLGEQGLRTKPVEVGGHAFNIGSLKPICRKEFYHILEILEISYQDTVVPLSVSFLISNCSSLINAVTPRKYAHYLSSTLTRSKLSDYAIKTVRITVTSTLARKVLGYRSHYSVEQALRASKEMRLRHLRYRRNDIKMVAIEVDESELANVPSTSVVVESSTTTVSVSDTVSLADAQASNLYISEVSEVTSSGAYNDVSQSVSSYTVTDVTQGSATTGNSSALLSDVTESVSSSVTVTENVSSSSVTVTDVTQTSGSSTSLLVSDVAQTSGSSASLLVTDVTESASSAVGGSVLVSDVTQSSSSVVVSGGPSSVKVTESSSVVSSESSQQSSTIVSGSTTTNIIKTTTTHVSSEPRVVETITDGDDTIEVIERTEPDGRIVRIRKIIKKVKVVKEITKDEQGNILSETVTKKETSETALPVVEVSRGA